MALDFKTRTMVWKQSLILSESLQKKNASVAIYFFLTDLLYVYFKCLSDYAQMWVSGREKKRMFLNSADKKNFKLVVSHLL